MDGENIGLDLNYGTRIGKKGFYQFYLIPAIPRSHSRPEQQADLFNGYNAISHRAAQDNINIDGLYKTSTIHRIQTRLLIISINTAIRSIISLQEKNKLFRMPAAYLHFNSYYLKDYTTQELAYPWS